MLSKEIKYKVLESCLSLGNYKLNSGRFAHLKFEVEKLDIGLVLFQIIGYLVPKSIPVAIPSGGVILIKNAFDRYGICTNKSLSIPVDLQDYSRNVTLIDDVCTTGGSFERATAVLDLVGYTVVSKVCLLNRGDYDCISLINKQDLLDYLGL